MSRATARARLEAAMVDTCTITRDPEGTSDATIDWNTGNLTEPSPDATTVYTGDCLVTEQDQSNRQTERGGEQESPRRYKVSIPTSAAAVLLGDVVTINACEADPQLVGKKLFVREVRFGSMIARRQLTSELIQVAPR